MSRKVRWGILSTARIGVEKVIPGMLRSQRCEVAAIASRNLHRAGKTAEALGIPQCYGSYEELLDDPSITAIYNPLPNHLHLEWTQKAIESGKHVLCEKPLVLQTGQVRQLIASRDAAGVKVGEAFMVHTHPQWLEVLKQVRSGELGNVRAIQYFFGYHNIDAANIRNIREYGGGALWDIGVYPIHTSRVVFNQEPSRVISLVKRDPDFGTDILSSAILDFPDGQVTFQCSTALAPDQIVTLYGDKKRLEIEIPFNAPFDRPCRLFLNAENVTNEPEEIVEIPACDQYGVQADCFSQAILDDAEVPVPLENSLGNIATVEALFRSELSGRWERPLL